MSGQHMPGRIEAEIEESWAPELRGGDIIIAAVPHRMEGSEVRARDEANIRRLAACWNAFVGLPTADIEQVVLDKGPLAVKMKADDVERDNLRTALATAEKMIADRDALIERHEKSYLVLANCLEDVSVGNQAAWIEWRHGAGAEAAMGWIECGLDGPGLIPDEAAPYAKQAQAWFDANRSNPFPKCFCGMPSNIGWMGHGFCSDGHYQQVRAQSVIPGMPTARELHEPSANTARLALHMAAVDLIRQAELLSHVLTIAQRPCLPLAMGNYDTVVEIRAAMVRP